MQQKTVTFPHPPRFKFGYLIGLLVLFLAGFTVQAQTPTEHALAKIEAAAAEQAPISTCQTWT